MPTGGEVLGVNNFAELESGLVAKGIEAVGEEADEADVRQGVVHDQGGLAELGAAAAAPGSLELAVPRQVGIGVDVGTIHLDHAVGIEVERTLRGKIEVLLHRRLGHGLHGHAWACLTIFLMS